MKTEHSSHDKVSASSEAPLIAERRMMIILHPDAGRAGDSTTHIQQLFEQQGIHAEIRLINEADPAAKLVECAVVEHYDGVVAAGGDGTVQQVAACLKDGAVPLGILPLGTMNNIAYSLGIPSNLIAACHIIHEGVVRNIDMGVMNGVPFLEVANIGAEVEMSEVVEANRHQSLFSTLHSLANSVTKLLGLRRHHLSLRIDGKKYITRAWNVTISNMPYYGLRYRPSLTTRIDDGLLDVIILRHHGLLGFVGHYWDLLWQRHGISPEVSILRARRIEIAARHPLPIGISGYSEGTTPAIIEVAPGALRVFAPMAHQPSSAQENPLTNILQSIAPAPAQNDKGNTL